MSLFMTFVIAVRALRRNAMRTALTALGMIIGVAAVIVMMALGSGARNSIETQIRSVGYNLVTVNAGAGRFGPVRGGQGEGCPQRGTGHGELLHHPVKALIHLEGKGVQLVEVVVGDLLRPGVDLLEQLGLGPNLVDQAPVLQSQVLVL